MGMAHLSVNGEVMQVERDCALAVALAHWGYSELEIAVAINGEFVPRSTYASRQLADGDAVDVLSPVQGG